MLGGRHCLLLHTVGAKTGIRRTTALTYARDKCDFLVVASMAGAPNAPGWFHNLKAAPLAEINVASEKLLVHARAVVPGDTDYARLWRIVNSVNSERFQTYQDRTSRPIPVVVLTPSPVEKTDTPESTDRDGSHHGTESR
jgi:deazaflavin-dependent oxidoreductase (nitroreductase family)